MKLRLNTLRLLILVSLPLLTAFSCALPPSKQLQTKTGVSTEQIHNLLIENGYTCIYCKDGESYRKYSIEYQSEEMILQMNSNQQSGKYYFRISSRQFSDQKILDEYSTQFKSLLNEYQIRLSSENNKNYRSLHDGFDTDHYKSINISNPTHPIFDSLDDNWNLLASIFEVASNSSKKIGLSPIEHEKFILGIPCYKWFGGIVEGPFKYSHNQRVQVCINSPTDIEVTLFGKDQKHLNDWLADFKKVVSKQHPQLQFSDPSKHISQIEE